LVGTGGGTAMGNGFTNKLTREGFSRHTGESRELAKFFKKGSSSRALPEALLFNLWSKDESKVILKNYRLANFKNFITFVSLQVK